MLAEDNGMYRPEPPPAGPLDHGPPPRERGATRKPERILFCGWRRDVRDILLLLDRQVCAGTEVHMMTDSVPLGERDERLREEGLDVDDDLRHLRIVHKEGNTSVRRALEALPIESYDSCMILADQQFEQDMMHSDSHALASLLLLRDIQRDRFFRTTSAAPDGDDDGGVVADAGDDADVGELGPAAGWGAEPIPSSLDDYGANNILQAIAAAFAPASSATAAGGGSGEADEDCALMPSPRSLRVQSACPTICEILDPRTQNTIRSNRTVAGASDFIQSNKLVAQILAMVCEDRGVRAILIELLGADGVNFSVRPSRRYAAPHEELSFFELQIRAQAHDEVHCALPLPPTSLS